jgi:hypothetical protein
MHAIRRHLRACTSIALVAIALLAVGPTISRLTLPEVTMPLAADRVAMHQAATHHAPLDGTAAVMVDGIAIAAVHAGHHAPEEPAGAPTPAPPAHQHTLEHCALCVVALFAVAVAPPPPSVVVPAAAPLSVAISRHAGIAPGRDTWSPTGSRGPPAFA